MDQIISFFQNPTIVAIFTFLSGASISYFLAHYNATKPMKLEIKKRQFEEVYLPLYNLFYGKDLSIMSIEEKTLLLTKINSVIEKHIELTFPTLLDLLSETPLSLEKIHINIDYEYALLKKILGYPSVNYYQLYKRMTPKNKRLFCLYMIPAFLIFLFGIYFFVILAKQDLIVFFIVVGFYSVFFYVRALIKTIRR